MDYLRATGAETVVAGGASIGAMASLSATIRGPAGISALMWFAGGLNGGYTFAQPEVQAVELPAFLASTTGDTVTAAADTETLASWWGGPNDLVLLPGTSHGTDIFTMEDPAVGQQFQAELVEFLGTLG